ncbi:hypothetical protein AB0C93_24595 [Streptomyces sp. NPDC048518]|uniref:hypothetical protein n=1 Tax=Streptomyces sp. NPDC048518 TaxID=3155029 RepID=UPI0033EA5D7A
MTDPRPAPGQLPTATPHGGLRRPTWPTPPTDHAPTCGPLPDESAPPPGGTLHPAPRQLPTATPHGGLRRPTWPAPPTDHAPTRGPLPGDSAPPPGGKPHPTPRQLAAVTPHDGSRPPHRTRTANHQPDAPAPSAPPGGTP